MKDKSFLYFTQDEIISKMNIDSRIQDTFKNVFMKIQDYFNQKGYTDERNYYNFLSEIMLDPESPFSIKIDDTHFLISEFEGRHDFYKNEILLNINNLQSNSLEHILCHEIVHFLSSKLSSNFFNSVAQDAVDGKIEIPFTTCRYLNLDNGFTEEALTEMITSEIMQQDIMSYHTQIQIQSYFNELVGEDVIKNFFNGFVYEDLNKIKKYIGHINDFEQKFLNNEATVLIEDNVDLVLAQRELIQTFLNPKDIKNIEDYISSYEKLLNRPIEDIDYVNGIISQMDKIILGNIDDKHYGDKKSKIEEIKKILERKHFFGDKEIYQFEFSNKTLGITPDGVVYGNLDNIGIDDSKPHTIVLWNENGKNISLSLDNLVFTSNGEKYDIDLNNAKKSFNAHAHQSKLNRPIISRDVRKTAYTRDILTPHITDPLRTDGEIVMEEEFGKEMPNIQQSTFYRPHIPATTKRKVEERDLRLQNVYKNKSTTQSQISGKTEKSKLEEQRRDLRRMQFGEKSKSTVVNTQKVPNLNDVLRQQQIIQQQQQIKMEDELEQHNGMSM